MICQQVTLSGYAEWPKVADAVIEAELAFPHVQVVPQGEPNHATVACDTIEPGTNRIFVYLHDPRRGT